MPKSILASKASYLVILMTLCGTVMSAPSPHDKLIKEELWGNIYKNGGQCFYTKKPFTKKTALLSESYIYSKSWIREHLQCGTSRQCARENEEYSAIISDLHNIVAANSSLAFKLNTATFGILDHSIEPNEFGMRTRFHIVEPDNSVKGDIARTIFYMHKTYELPIRGSMPDFILWNEIDPPSQEEKERNDLIESIQGKRNQFIDHPEKIGRPN